MTKEYLKLFTKRKMNWGLLTALIIIQILGIWQGYSQENLIAFFISQKNLNIFAFFLTPLFCFWNSSSYQVCSETKCVVRMGSPFSHAIWYLKFSLSASVLYVLFSNIVTILAGIIVLKEIITLGYVFILMFFQLIFYLNCAAIYFLVVTSLHNKFYLGFFAMVLYGLLDFIGQVVSLYTSWINISTSFVVSSLEQLSNPFSLMQNFSVLVGTFLALYVTNSFLIEKKDFIEWGKGHD